MRLDDASADRLTKLCRLFGSDHLGERAAAAAKAHGLLVALKLDWRDVIRPTLAPPAHGDRPRTGTWRENLVLAVMFLNDLTPWERGFVESMRTRLDATAKQRTSLAEIAARLRARGRV